jgi:cephalosporin-C deacetylase-like acetyl esterase
MPDENLIEFMKDPDVFITSVQQAVMDVRRSARWLESQPQVDKDRIGLCGTSLGGFIAALAGGVDGGFNKIALVLAGGDMAAVLTTDSREVREIKKHLNEMEMTEEKITALFEPIEPLTFAKRLKASKILMLNGTQDTIVPPLCSEKLAQATGAEIYWFEADHYGMSKFLLPALGKVNAHFSGDKW